MSRPRSPRPAASAPSVSVSGAVAGAPAATDSATGPQATAPARPIPIAIVGMGCRFADAPDLTAYWAQALEGRHAFGPVPADRWDAAAFFDANPRATDKSYAPTGAFIADVRSFPALALQVPPRRVEVMDPQQRFTLEVALEAIADAGTTAEKLPHRTGVFVGVTATEYKTLLVSRTVAQLMASGALGSVTDAAAIASAVERVVPSRPLTAPGLLGNMCAATVAQELDLHGPAYTTDAACASASVALVDAMAHLRAGTIDAALAGGVYLCLTPEHHLAFSRIGAMSKSGVCRPFDSRADGFVQGDGVGMVLLKRLDDALRDGDRVYAVLAGMGLNSDGRGTGPMAPVLGGQRGAIEAAWADAGLDPETLGYYEAHGTGTLVGDATEFQGMVDALGDRARRVAVGSSKANVGHTMSGAGIAGLIRAALALHHGVVPPMANFDQARHDLPLAGSPFHVPQTVEPFEGAARTASVSSFGFGGTNVHLVLATQELVAATNHTATHGALHLADRVEAPELVLLSAPDVPALRALAGRMAAAVRAEAGATVAAVARTLAARPVQRARLGLVAAGREALIAALEKVAAGQRAEGASLDLAPEVAPKVAFLYPGQGSQRPGMIADIVERYPVVADRLAAVEAALDADLALPLTHYLYPERRAVAVTPERAMAELTETVQCQPALLAVGAALTDLLAAVGVKPAVTLGHSLGEFTAAAASGVLSAEDAARFVARRGRAMMDLPGDHGAMAAVMAAADVVEPLLVPGAVLANFNHPRQVVVSGTSPAVAAVVAAVQAAGHKAVPLTVSHAFHSPVMAPVDPAPLLDGLTLQAPRVPLASGVTGHTYADAADARLAFGQHAVQPVRFTDALETAAGLGARVFLQVGAGGPLAAFARGALRGGDTTVLSLAGTDDRDGGRSLLEGLARLFTLGVAVNVRPLLAAPAPGEAPLAILPPVVWPREVYWGVKDEPQLPFKLPAGAPVSSRAVSADSVANRVESAPMDSPKTSSNSKGSGRDVSGDPGAISPNSGRDVSAAPADRAAEVAGLVLAAVAKVSAYPVGSIDPTQALVRDLGFDSLMLVDLGETLARSVPGLGGVPQSVLVNEPTVRSVVDYVVGALSAEVSPTATPADDDAPLSDYALSLWPAGPAPAWAEHFEPRPLPRQPGEAALRLHIHCDDTALLGALADAVRGADAGALELTFGPSGGLAPGPVDAILFCATPGAGGTLGEVFAAEGEAVDFAAAFLASVAHQSGLGARPAILVARNARHTMAAGLDGAVRALAREWPEARPRLVVTEAAFDVRALAHAVLFPTDDAERYLDAAGTAFVPALTPLAVRSAFIADEVTSPSNDAERSRAAVGGPFIPAPDEVMLVTGGTRGLGLAVATRAVAAGAQVILLGRGAPDSAALALDQANPGRVHFVRADVCDAVALTAALKTLPPVTTLVHAAGVLADGPVGAVAPEVGVQARDVKLKGWLTALYATRKTLRRALAVGSWAGRFGNRNQTHYAAANAALAGAVDAGGTVKSGGRNAGEQSLLGKVGKVGKVVAELGPIVDSAMVAGLPASVVAGLRAEGVQFTTTARAVDALWRDLDEADVLRGLGRPGMVVVHGRDLPATRRTARHTHVLSVATHPYLADHAIDGTPVLPLAMAAELMARAAGMGPADRYEMSDLTLYSGVRVAGTVVIDVEAEGEQVSLHRRGADGARTLAYRAAVRPIAEKDEAPVLEGRESADPTLPLATFLTEVTFHGPLLWGLETIYGVGDDFVWGRLKQGSPAAWLAGAGADERFALDPLVLDSGMLLGAYVAHTRDGRGGTPISMARFTRHDPFVPGEPVHCVARFGPSEGDRFVTDLFFYSADGNLVAEAQGVVAELRARPSSSTGGGSQAPDSKEKAAGDALPFDAAPYARFADVGQFAEVLAMEQRIADTLAAGLRMPYFTVHEGTAAHTSVVAGRELVNFSSYNYLGLSGDPRVNLEVGQAVARYGTSVSASRVASGERPFHGDLERRLAACQGAEDALLFTAGHATNVTVVGHLMGARDLVLHDELIHDSILQGIALSGAARRSFKHDDPAHLEDQLRRLRPHYEKVLIVVEGVYSMDGDIARVPEYIDLKRRYGCLLMVDEAHSFGIIGATGQGVREHFGLRGDRGAGAEVDVWMGTLSKSLASCGGWVAGSKRLIQYLRFTAPGFVYSAGLTPANGQAALSSLRYMLAEPWRVEKLQANARFFCRAMAEAGVDVGVAAGESAVVPAITGNSLHAMLLSARLLDLGINVQPIVYPAVAESAARLRFFLSSTHTRAELALTAEAVGRSLMAIRAAH